jgi:hypothetical protein
MYSPIFSGKTDRRIPWTVPEPAAYASPGSFYKSERSAFLAELIRSRWSGTAERARCCIRSAQTTQADPRIPGTQVLIPYIWKTMYKLYRRTLYNLYCLLVVGWKVITTFHILPRAGHINVRGKWFHLAQTSAKDARTAQLRPQDVSKHVPTCADILNHG